MEEVEKLNNNYEFIECMEFSFFSYLLFCCIQKCCELPKLTSLFNPPKYTYYLLSGTEVDEREKSIANRFE